MGPSSHASFPYFKGFLWKWYGGSMVGWGSHYWGSLEFSLISESSPKFPLAYCSSLIPRFFCCCFSGAIKHVLQFRKPHLLPLKKSKKQHPNSKKKQRGSPISPSHRFQLFPPESPSGGLAAGTWRIIPVSKWLVIPIYKPFRPFIKGITPFRRLTNHGY